MTCWEINIAGQGWRWTSAELASLAECFSHGPNVIRLADVPRCPAIVFKRMARVERPAITGRRLAAAKRAMVNEQLRQGGPLFAAHVAATQPTPQARCEAFDRAAEDWDRQDRQRAAAQWKRGRAILASHPPDVRDLLVHAWNGCGFRRSRNGSSDSARARRWRSWHDRRADRGGMSERNHNAEAAR